MLNVSSEHYLINRIILISVACVTIFFLHIYKQGYTPDLYEIRRPEVSKLSGEDRPKVLRMRLKTGTGSAWAFNSDGDWMTAKHVVDSCNLGAYVGKPSKSSDDNVLMNNTEKLFMVSKTKIYRLPKERDLAVLRGASNRLFLEISDFEYNRSHIGKEGFFVGFPRGKEGEVYTKLIGKYEKLNHKAAASETFLTWSIVTAHPLRDSYRGLSGGPVLSNNGRVLGLTVSESMRRGRLYASQPKDILSLIDSKNLAHPKSKLSTLKINTGNYSEIAKNLRKSFTVVQVLCFG